MKNQNKSGGRNSTVELLRFFFMLSIVLLHVYGHGSHLNYRWIYSLGDNCDTAIHLALYSLCKLGVTGFMFISGYYGIRMDKIKLLKLVVTSFLYFVGLQMILGGRGWQLVMHPWDAWWYIGGYFIIILLSPMVELAYKHLEKKMLILVISGFVFMTYAIGFVSGSNSHDLMLLLTIYLVAMHVRKYPSQEDSCIMRYLPVICIISLLIIAFTPIVIQNLGLPIMVQKIFISNNNILLLIAVASLVILADGQFFSSKSINWLAKGILAIYLITDWKGMREVLDTWLLPHVMNGIGFLYILLICISCMIIGAIVDSIISVIICRFCHLKSD